MGHLGRHWWFWAVVALLVVDMMIPDAHAAGPTLVYGLGTDEIRESNVIT